MAHVLSFWAETPQLLSCTGQNGNVRQRPMRQHKGRFGKGAARMEDWWCSYSAELNWYTSATTKQYVCSQPYPAALLPRPEELNRTPLRQLYPAALKWGRDRSRLVLWKRDRSFEHYAIDLLIISIWWVRCSSFRSMERTRLETFSIDSECLISGFEGISDLTMSPICWEDWFWSLAFSEMEWLCNFFRWPFGSWRPSQNPFFRQSSPDRSC